MRAVGELAQESYLAEALFAAGRRNIRSFAPAVTAVAVRPHPPTAFCEYI